MIIARDKYLRQLIEARGNGMVKIVTGMRRSGQTFPESIRAKSISILEVFV